jgi:hypothetical protein
VRVDDWMVVSGSAYVMRWWSVGGGHALDGDRWGGRQWMVVSACGALVDGVRQMVTAGTVVSAWMVTAGVGDGAADA